VCHEKDLLGPREERLDDDVVYESPLVGAVKWAGAAAAGRRADSREAVRCVGWRPGVEPWAACCCCTPKAGSCEHCCSCFELAPAAWSCMGSLHFTNNGGMGGTDRLALGAVDVFHQLGSRVEVFAAAYASLESWIHVPEIASAESVACNEIVSETKLSPNETLS
jgi:hypothetical protein